MASRCGGTSTRTGQTGLRPAIAFLIGLVVAAGAVLGASPPARAMHAGEVLALNARLIELVNARKLVEAEALGTRALAAAEATGEEDVVALTLTNLGEAYRVAGRFEKATALYQRAIEICERPRPRAGLCDESLMGALNNLAFVHKTLAEYSAARPLYERALALEERRARPNANLVATFAENLAFVEGQVGSRPRAEALYARAVALREKHSGPAHPKTAQVLNNLALFHLEGGDYARAESLLRRALAIREKALGPDHPDTAQSLTNLGVLYRHLADYGRAQALYERALPVVEKAYGAAHPVVGQTLNNLGVVYELHGNREGAARVYGRALAVFEQAFGPEHPEVAVTLLNLGRLAGRTNEHARAEAYHQRALAIEEKVHGADHPRVARALNRLLEVQLEGGDPGAAEALSERAVRILRKGPPDHPELAAAVSARAIVKAARGKDREALEDHRESADAFDRQLVKVFAFTTEREKVRWVEHIGAHFDSAVSFVQQRLSREPDAVRFGAELVLRRKGLVLDQEARARQATGGRLSAAQRAISAELTASRLRLSGLLFNPPPRLTVAELRQTVVALQETIDELERRLAREKAGIAAGTEPGRPLLAAASRALARDTVLIEFARVRWRDAGTARWQPARYLAFVVRAGNEVRLIDLGAASEIDGAVRDALRAIRASQTALTRETVRRSSEALRRLHGRVWLPVESLLAGAAKLFIAPDGQLNLVPFAALADEQDRPLASRYLLAYVTSGRELGQPAPPSGDGGVDLMVVADPDFGVPDGSPARSRAGFTPLPGTAAEARSITALMSGPAKRLEVLVGARATEAALRQARAPRVLHLATHGFFLEAEPPERQERYLNPLLLSGLALAGANRGSTGAEGDGILTALEVTDLDLRGTELVVLSACETGLGEVRNGEGVFGLRRAFTLAGARHLVMSLWPVDDAVTMRQMEDFYAGIRAGASLADALRQAQLRTIAELTSRLGVAPPILWAPFVLQGPRAFETAPGR